MKRILYSLVLLFCFASCAKNPSSDFPLQEGLYTCEVEDGVICVRIFKNLQCDIYFEGYEDYDRWKTYHGTITYNGGGLNSIFSIKGYAHKPYEDKESIDPSSTFYRWQYIYTFTNSAGAILSETSFQYFLETQRPWDEDKTVSVVFVKH